MTAQIVPAEPAGQPGQLGVHHGGRHGPQRDHGRGDPGGVDRGPVGGQFGLADGPHGGHVGVPGRGGVPAQLVKTDHGHARQAGGFRLDVPRQGQVDQDQRPVPAGGGRGDLGAGDDVASGAGAGHHGVGGGQGGGAGG